MTNALCTVHPSARAHAQVGLKIITSASGFDLKSYGYSRLNCRRHRASLQGGDGAHVGHLPGAEQHEGQHGDYSGGVLVQFQLRPWLLAIPLAYQKSREI